VRGITTTVLPHPAFGHLLLRGEGLTI